MALFDRDPTFPTSSLTARANAMDARAGDRGLAPLAKATGPGGGVVVVVVLLLLVGVIATR